MSPKFSSEHVACPDKYFQTVCYFFKVESKPLLEATEKKMVLTLNSFINQWEENPSDKINVRANRSRYQQLRWPSG